MELIPGVVAPKIVRSAGPLGTLPPGMAGDVTEQEGSAAIDVRAAYDADRRQYLLQHLGVTLEGGGEVTGVLLRKIAPLSIMRWVVPLTFLMEIRTHSRWVMRFANPIGNARNTPTGPDETASLQDAASIYRLAEILREPPAKAVAETLGLQKRTATNWLSRAREQGLLD